MDQFMEARIRAEKMAKRRGRPPKARLLSELQEQELEPVPEVPAVLKEPTKKTRVMIRVEIDLGDKVVDLEYYAPGFSGTVLSAHRNERTLREMVGDALRTKFGKML